MEIGDFKLESPFILEVVEGLEWKNPLGLETEKTATRLLVVGKGQQLFYVVTINRQKLKAIIDLGTMINALALDIAQNINISQRKKTKPY